MYVVSYLCHAVCFVLPCTQGYSLLRCDTMESGRHMPAAQRNCLLCCVVSTAEDGSVIVRHLENSRYCEDSYLMGLYTGSCLGLLYLETEVPAVL